DLDQFKYINDAFSQAGGDRLLQLVADRLRTGVRSNDTIARFGGDEFAILLRDVSQRDAATMCGALIELMAREPFATAGGSLRLRWSIGATMIRGSKVSAETLLTRADRACYQAKTNGRNQFAFYHVASKDVAERTADANWSQRIQKALKEDAFVLHYQP